MFFKDSDLYAVDTKKHKQFRVTKDAYLRLADWIYTDTIEYTKPIDNELINSGILSESEDSNSYWAGDVYSYLFHNLTRNISSKIPQLTEKEFIENYIKISEKSSANLSKLETTSLSKKTKITLPQPDLNSLENKSILFALYNRKTSRNFNNSPSSIEEISTLLYLSFGYIHGTEWSEFKTLNIEQCGIRKSSPSASGLHACDAYLAAININGIPEGIYLYDPTDHTLIEITTSLNINEVKYFVCDQFWVDGISAGIFITIDLRKVWIKDPHIRGLPVAYAEAGHFSQTLQLISTSLDLNTWITGTFRDEEVANKLDLKSDYQFPCFFVGVGYGENTAIPKEFFQLTAE